MCSRINCMVGFLAVALLLVATRPAATQEANQTEQQQQPQQQQTEDLPDASDREQTTQRDTADRAQQDMQTQDQQARRRTQQRQDQAFDQDLDQSARPRQFQQRDRQFDRDLRDTQQFDQRFDSRDRRRSRMQQEDFRQSARIRTRALEGADLGVSLATGAQDRLIVEDVTGGIADVIGLRASDVIVSVDGRRVATPVQFERILYDVDFVDARPLPIVVLRDGRRETLYLEPDELDLRFRERGDYFTGGAWLGVKLDTRYENAAVVRQVVPDSPADYAGVRANDRIVGINGRRVNSPNHLTTLLSSMDPGEEVELRVERRLTRSLYATLEGEQRGEPRQVMRPTYDEEFRIEERQFYRGDPIGDFDPDFDRRGYRDRVGPGERGLRDRLDRDEVLDEPRGLRRRPFRP